MDQSRKTDYQRLAKTLDIRKKFYTVRVVRLPREIVDAPSLQMFKAGLDGAVSKPGLMKSAPAHGRMVKTR